MAVLEGRNLSLLEAVTQIADPAKLERFDALAGEFRNGRGLIALLSKPGGSSEHLWSYQYELKSQGKDAFRLCCEMQDLHASLIADFVAAAMEARFTVNGFIRATSQTLDPQLFGMPGLQLRLDRNEITLSDGTVIMSVQITLPRQPEVPGVRVAREVSDKAVKPDSGRRRRRGRIPKPIWEGAETEMMQWLDRSGCPEPGDGGQGALEDHIADWLAKRDYYLAESTVRAHVAACIARRRAC
jgi:hypothetical protein